jgi:hypothetical protein
MKRLVATLAFAALLVFSFAIAVPSATAHGTCTTFSFKPNPVSGSSIFFGSARDCFDVGHGHMTITAELQRRLPGGSWAYPPVGIWHIHTSNTFDDFLSTGAWGNYNCRYSYRTRAVGGNDGHSTTTVFSVAKPPTC